MENAMIILLPDMAFDTVDTRGLDLYPSLYPVGDAIASVISVTVKRCDDSPLVESDLTTYPDGRSPPAVVPNPAGVPAMAVAWWQAVGSPCSTDDLSVDYVITVKVVTIGGRRLAYAVAQTVIPTAARNSGPHIAS